MLTTSMLLAANNLIEQFQEKAEEHATAKLWDARQSANESEAAQWHDLLEALKEVRRIRRRVT